MPAHSILLSGLIREIERVGMANLRKEAKGRECQVRLPGVCNFNSETTVLAHYRMAGLNGVGMKPDDIFGLGVAVVATMNVTVEHAI